EAVREYLQKLAGTHLDPLVVRHFLGLLDDRTIGGQIEALDDKSIEMSWSPPPIPADEAERLEALRRYEWLDTPSEEFFDEITRLATSLCETPMGLISLVDADRQWFKSRVGLSIQEVCRDVSICAHAIIQDELFLIPDTRIDARFAHNPLVVTGPKIRFYAGAPLITPAGHVIGTLCVMDHVPRSISPTQRDMLRVLAQSIVAELDRRQQLREKQSLEQDLKKQEAAYHKLVQAIPQKVYRKDLRGCFTFENNYVHKSRELRSDEIQGRTDYESLPVSIAEQYRDDDLKIIQTRQTIELVEAHHPDATRASYVHSVHVPNLDDNGTTLDIQGMPFDITDRVLAERPFGDVDTRFHAFMDYSPCAAFIKNEQMRYVYVNSQFEALCQLTSAEILGKSDAEILTRWNVLRRQESDARVIESGESVQLVESVECRDGFLREFLTVKFPFLDASGKPMLGGVTLDVTPQKAIERTLSDQLGLAERLNAELTCRSRSLEQINAKLMEQATTDSLTGLRNRRAFVEALEAALSEAHRHARPLSVLMLDVDNFKSYNDDHGHPAGDTVLCEVASILMNHARAHDLAARYGGEEFVVLLPNASDEEATAAAFRLLEAIAQHPWPLRPITASFGVASLVVGERFDAQALMEGADRALYHSKRNGRDRVTHIRELHSAPSPRRRPLGV
ncbi:MAG TPA: diguanylate cyclase, partial [Isosphaeraceae bacterium]|nr:diguanylate cyclase [Isosphaeraceae bacterium]